MKKVLKGIWSVLEIVIIIYAIILTSFILSRNKFGYTQFGDYTFYNVSLIGENNIDDVKKGDLLIVKNSNDINEGDLIYYYAAYNDNYVIKSNRVLEIKKDGSSSLYTVDNEERLQIQGPKVLGKYKHIYHTWGSVLTLLESRMGFLFLVLLPIMIVFIYQIYEFIIILRYEKVDDLSKEGEKETSKEEKTEVPEEKKEEQVEEVKEETPVPKISEVEPIEPVSFEIPKVEPDKPEMIVQKMDEDTNKVTQKVVETSHVEEDNKVIDKVVEKEVTVEKEPESDIEVL